MRHTLTGYKARFIFAELKKLATLNDALLLSLIEQTLDREKDVKLALKALQNNSEIRRVVDLLREGKTQEAEDLVTEQQQWATATKPKTKQ